MSDSMTTGDHRPFTPRVQHMLCLGTLRIPLQDQSNTFFTNAPYRLGGGENAGVGSDRTFASKLNFQLFPRTYN